MTRSLRTVFSALVMMAVLLTALPALAAPPALITDVSKQIARVEAFKQLVDIMSAYKNGEPVDYAAATALYRDKLQETVRARDAKYGEELDIAITAALQAGQDGQLSDGVAKQLVDKLGQKVFYLSVKHETEVAKENLAKGNLDAAVHNIDEAIAYYEALRGTVQKRDQAFGLNMEAEIDGALDEAQKAAQKGDEARLWLVSPAITHTIQRTFQLAVGGYAEKVEAGAKAGKDVRVEMAEGWAFYQSIKGTVGKRTPELAQLVEAQLNPVQGDPQAVNADAIKAAMAAGFAGYVEHEVDATWQNWGGLKRLHTAMEGAVIARAISDAVGTVLGADRQAAFDSDAQAFVNAVWEQDRTRAETHGKALAATAADLRARLSAKALGVPADAIVLTIGQTTASVFGQSQTLEAAPFITGGRAMVPVRLIAEGLGAQVDWQAATQTVRIALGGKVILLPIGQTTATVDGQPVTLDAAATITNGRTFVPVRFVSETLGAAVTWQAATQQVVIRPAK